jgi:hypothetical protein
MNGKSLTQLSFHSLKVYTPAFTFIIVLALKNLGASNAMLLALAREGVLPNPG